MNRRLRISRARPPRRGGGGGGGSKGGSGGGPSATGAGGVPIAAEGGTDNDTGAGVPNPPAEVAAAGGLVRCSAVVT